VIFLDKFFDQRDLFRDVIGCGGLLVWSQKSESFGVFVEFFGPVIRDFLQRPTFLACLSDRFVVDIGQVSNMENFLAARFECAAKDILKDKTAEIADMCGTVNGRSAAIVAESFAVERDEFADGSAKRIV